MISKRILWITFLNKPEIIFTRLNGFTYFNPKRIILLYNHNQQYIHIYMQKYIQHSNDERIQFFRKIYLSLYSKRVRKGYEGYYCLRGEFETEQRLQHIDPQLSRLSQPFFPVLLSCSTGGMGAQLLLGHGSHSSIFSPTNLNFLSPGLYNNLTSTYFLRASQFALNSTPRQSRSLPDIFDRMHLLFTQVHFFFWQLGRVGGQYATILFTINHLFAHSLMFSSIAMYHKQLN